jgi:hypothetical protein
MPATGSLEEFKKRAKRKSGDGETQRPMRKVRGLGFYLYYKVAVKHGTDVVCHLPTPR